MNNDFDEIEFLIAWVGGNCIAALFTVYLLTTHGIL